MQIFFFKVSVFLSAFLEWLAAEEKNTNSKFVIACSKKKMKDHIYMSFACSRNGTYKPKLQDPERQLKAQGSKKLGFHCTASVHIKEYATRVSAVYYHEHYKHDESLAHIPIPKTDKENIAGNFFIFIENIFEY